ncbi:hypothetical protein H696_00761 [Fonticula alba]|uniref:Uncharacterized protein n=1 Tax=Fonticula alba TaxID=691883 RepID=A0A058ZFT4_FONAL|nr:hypothetical protein H696_00761 [Fonticula alba]KCV73219.1 hypothetical protein H696_00761 [Fonticula alba]|eukprot:XP_009492920.1 hypothetical protein H696_00761 [Fonticula alba]
MSLPTHPSQPGPFLVARSPPGGSPVTMCGEVGPSLLANSLSSFTLSEASASGAPAASGGAPRPGVAPLQSPFLPNSFASDAGDVSPTGGPSFPATISAGANGHGHHAPRLLPPMISSQCVCYIQPAGPSTLASPTIAATPAPGHLCGCRRRCADSGGRVFTRSAPGNMASTVSRPDDPVDQDLAFLLGRLDPSLSSGIAATGESVDGRMPYIM